MEKQVIQSVGFRNIRENGEVTGFQFKIRLPYYRGIFLSQIMPGTLYVDGERIEKDAYLLMFPRHDRSSIKSINVHNEYGEYTLVRYTDETFYLAELPAAPLNDEALASVVVASGYVLVMITLFVVQRIMNSRQGRSIMIVMFMRESVSRWIFRNLPPC